MSGRDTHDPTGIRGTGGTTPEEARAMRSAAASMPAAALNSPEFPERSPVHESAPPLSAREAARRRHPLDGTDAQALEHALTITERERDKALADYRYMVERAAKLPYEDRAREWLTHNTDERSQAGLVPTITVDRLATLLADVRGAGYLDGVSRGVDIERRRSASAPTVFRTSSVSPSPTKEDLAIPCTCGSGGHPRECAAHPLARELHCAELSLANVTEERDDLASEVERLRTPTASPDYAHAIKGAGFHVAKTAAHPFLGATDEDEWTLWCDECGRDSGYHHPPCSKLAVTMADRRTCSAIQPDRDDLEAEVISLRADLDAQAAELAISHDRRASSNAQPDLAEEWERQYIWAVEQLRKTLGAIRTWDMLTPGATSDGAFFRKLIDDTLEHTVMRSGLCTGSAQTWHEEHQPVFDKGYATVISLRADLDAQAAELARLRSASVRPARLDKDGTAKPLTEIVAVMPADGAGGGTFVAYTEQATHYVVRATDAADEELVGAAVAQSLAGLETRPMAGRGACVTGDAMVMAVDLDACTVRLHFDGHEDRDMREWAVLLGKTVSVTAGPCASPVDPDEGCDCDALEGGEHTRLCASVSATQARAARKASNDRGPK